MTRSNVKLTIVQRGDADEMLCPYHDLPLRRTGDHWRCVKCDMGKVDHEYMPFNGARVQMARESRCMAVEELAHNVCLSVDQVQQVEARETRPDRETQKAIADTTGYPLAFFMQDDPPGFFGGWNSLDLHASLQYCECGAVLANKDERMPLVCSQCMEPTYGCPCCDADMHVNDRKGQRLFRCKQCGYRATVAEMLDLWEKGRLR